MLKPTYENYSMYNTYVLWLVRQVKSRSQCCVYVLALYTVYWKSFAGENFCELLKVRFLQSKLSQFVGNDTDMPTDNDAAVLNKKFCG